MSSTSPPHSVHSISQQEEQFLYQVGSAITAWAEIDERFFHIFCAIVKTQARIAAILYYRTNTIGARFELLNHLVTDILPSKGKEKDAVEHPVLAMWIELRTLFKDIIKVRNQLAHSPVGPMAHFLHDPDGNVTVSDSWWSCYSSSGDRMAGKVKPDLKLDDVKQHSQQLAQLWMMVRDFEGAITRFMQGHNS